MPPGYTVLLAALSAHLALQYVAVSGQRIPLVFLEAMDQAQENLDTLEGQDESTKGLELEVGIEDRENGALLNSEEGLEEEEPRKGKTHPGFSKNFVREGKRLRPNFFQDVVRKDNDDPWRGSFGERIAGLQRSGGPRRKKNEDGLAGTKVKIHIQEPVEPRLGVQDEEDEQYRSKEVRNIVLGDPEDWSQEYGIHRQNSPRQAVRSDITPNRAKILIQEPGDFRPSRTIQSSRSSFKGRKSHPGFSRAGDKSLDKKPSRTDPRFNGRVSRTQEEPTRIIGKPSIIEEKPISLRRQETTTNDPLERLIEQERLSKVNKTSTRVLVEARQINYKKVNNKIGSARTKNIEETSPTAPVKAREEDYKIVDNHIAKNVLKEQILESEKNDIASDDRFARSLLNTFPFKNRLQSKLEDASHMSNGHSPGARHVHPLVPSQSFGVINSRQREDSPASFADVASAQPDRDGQRCIDKVIMQEETEFDEYVECYHSYDKRCHTTYVTNFEPTQEEECDENYRKKCFIEYSISAYNQTVEVCHEPLVKDCDLIGPEVCSTQYESECWTKLEEHDVVDDVAECTVIKEQKCEDITIGYTSEQKCTEWPIQKCSLTKANVKKTSPITKCEKVPKQVCAPAGCGFVPGPRICYEKKEIVISDRPEESCSLEPQTTCKHVTKLVPKLEPKEECLDVPKELCSRSTRNPRKIRKPVVKKWCYTPSEESGLA